MELGAHMLLCRLEGGEAEGSGDLSPRDERGIELVSMSVSGSFLCQAYFSARMQRVQAGIGADQGGNGLKGLS